MSWDAPPGLEPPPGLDPDAQLFLGDPGMKSMSFLYRVWGPVGGAVLGGIVVLSANLVHKRPIFSALHRYAICIAGGTVAGEMLLRTKNRVLGEKDLQYYHYMTLHPEDFQAPERVKFKDYLTHWDPIR